MRPGLFCVIRNRAFYGCTSLTEISIPPTCKDIGYEAFAHSGLQTISIPNIDIDIGGAFRMAYELTNANVPGGAKGTAYAFADCYSLSSVQIGGGLEAIGEGMFQNSRKLNKVSIPASVTSIGKYAFQGSGVTNISTTGKNVVIDQDAFSQTPLNTFSGHVSEIKLGAFSQTPYLDTVVLTGDNININADAFSSSGLRELQIGSTGTVSISLKNLPYLESLTITGKEVSVSCHGLTLLKRINLSADKVYLGDFTGCQNLWEVDVSAETIDGTMDFSCCTLLHSLKFSGTLMAIPICRAASSRAGA